MPLALTHRPAPRKTLSQSGGIARPRCRPDRVGAVGGFAGRTPGLGGGLLMCRYMCGPCGVPVAPAIRLSTWRCSGSSFGKSLRFSFWPVNGSKHGEIGPAARSA